MRFAMMRVISSTVAVLSAVCGILGTGAMAGQPQSPAVGPTTLSVPAPASSTVQQVVRGHGLTIRIDVNWLPGPGYRPMKITCAPSPRTTADRTLRLELRIAAGRYYHNRENAIYVSQEVEIPAGSQSVETVLSVPPVGLAEFWNVSVYEDGNLLPGLELHGSTWRPQGRLLASIGHGKPLLLVVGDRLPGLHEMLALTPTPQTQPSAYPPAYRGQAIAVQDLQTAMCCAIQDLPERWIDYTSLDVVCLSLGQMAELQKKRTTAYQALLAWTAAGGNLWVCGVGEDWRGLGALEELTGFLTKSLSLDPVQRGWTIPSAPATQTPDDGRQGKSFGLVGSLNDYMARKAAEVARAKESDEPFRPHFVTRPLAMGLVVAFAANDPFPGTTSQWSAVFDATGPQRYSWPVRHGMVPGASNPDFWDFLIPGAGVAPVKTFCVLITLFVLGIGPANYWLLRRKGRLYLLLLTTPAIAAAVTLLLIGYAISADGLGVRVRARSATEIDQRRGQAVCWSRLCYCAGMTPRQGLRFPADVAVVPFEYMPEDPYAARPRREFAWADDQRLASGWLAARTPAQFITIRSRASGAGLDLLADESGAAPRVRNRLGTRVQQLLVCAADGRHFWAENVDADAAADLEPIQLSAAQESLLARYERERPVRPAEMAALGGLPQSFVSYQTSLQETLLASLAGADDRKLPLTPGSYVAVVDRSPEVVFGVPSPREVQGYHVVFGKW
jgi:hypothetical protein